MICTVINAALHLIAIAGYMAASVLLYLNLSRGRPGRPWVLAAAALAVLAHAIVLAATLRTHGALDLSFYHALSLVAWIVVALVVLVSLFKRFEVPGLVLFPVAALVVLVKWMVQSPPLLLAERSLAFNLHIALAFVAYALLSLAAAHALVLWLHERRLRRHKMVGVTASLPPLSRTETLMFQLIGAGFSLLTATLITGALFVDNLMAQHLVHKTTLSVVAWVVFAVLLFGRYRFGWRGPTAVGWTLAGMALLLLAYFGSKLVLELILSRTV